MGDEIVFFSNVSFALPKTLVKKREGFCLPDHYKGLWMPDLSLFEKIWYSIFTGFKIILKLK